MCIVFNSIISLVYILKKTALEQYKGEFVPDYLKSQLISWIDLIEKEDDNFALITDQFEKEGFYNNKILQSAIYEFLGEELTRKVMK